MRKSRKISYIRIKNKLREGKQIVYMIKTSKNTDINEVDLIINEVVKSVEKKFKTKLYVSDLKSEITIDDYIKGLITQYVFIKRKYGE